MSRRGPGRSERLYQVLLLMYPKEFRRRYGPHMVQVFGDLYREERERAGLIGLALLWARTILDLLQTAASERTRTATGATFVLPVAGSPRMVRWGAAAAIGGAACSLLATGLDILSVAYLKEPIFNALSAYQDGGSGYSPFRVLLHPIVSESLGILAVLLSVTAFLGLYALVSRRSGGASLVGGVLVCAGFGMFTVYAASNAYSMSVIFGGQLGHLGTNPFLVVADLGIMAFLVGALLLAFVVFRARALGPWSMLPLLVFFVGTVLRLVLIRTGLPVQHLPQAVHEGAVTLLFVHAPELVTGAGWVLLGWVLWRRSGEVRLDRVVMASPSRRKSSPQH